MPTSLLEMPVRRFASHRTLRAHGRAPLTAGVFWCAAVLISACGPGQDDAGTGIDAGAGRDAGAAGDADAGASDDAGSIVAPTCTLGISVTPLLDPAAANTVRVRIDNGLTETWPGHAERTDPTEALATFVSPDESTTLTMHFGQLTPGQCRGDASTWAWAQPGISFVLERDGLWEVTDPTCKIVLVETEEPGATGVVLRGRSSRCIMTKSTGETIEVTLTYDVETDGAACTALGQAPPAPVSPAAVDTVVVGRAGSDDLTLPLTELVLNQQPDDPHPLYAFFDDGVHQVQLDLKDLDSGACAWRIVNNGIVPYAHHNTVRWLDDQVPYSGTADLDCQMVIDNGQDTPAAFSGYTTQCALRNDAFPAQTVTLALRFAIDLTDAAP